MVEIERRKRDQSLDRGMSAALLFYYKGVKMDMTELTQIISTVGFPIAAYVAMFWYMIKQTEAHKEEMDSVKEAINANTQALIELRSYLGRNDHV